MALVFQSPQLRDMASAVTGKKARLLNGDDLVSCDQTHSSNFADSEEDMVLPSKDSVANLLSLPTDIIADILPLTDLQKYVVRRSLGTPRTEWNYISVRLPQRFDASQLAEICAKMADAVDILAAYLPPLVAETMYKYSCRTWCLKSKRSQQKIALTHNVRLFAWKTG